MHLVQILLPIYDNEHQAFPHELYGRVRSELTSKFHGLTAYTRAPAEGLWKQEGQHTSRDEIVIFEVMVPDLDRQWWNAYRQKLEKDFRQDVLIIRAIQTEVL